MHRPSILALAAIVSMGLGPYALAGGQKAEGHPPAVHSPGRTEAHSAPDSGSNTPIDEFDRLSPEEQQQKLARLPADQRRRLEERLRQFNRLPFEQRQMLRNLYSRLHQLAPGQQATVHKAIDRFSKQPAESQQAIRDELRLLSALPEQERAARVTSRDFRQGLTRKEQGIVRDMMPLLPLS
jgi:hypothetical protein